MIWQAIINVYNNCPYTNIVDNTKAIIFLGTPHHRADLANLLSNLLLVSFSGKIFVDQLHLNSKTIQEINNAFRDRSESLDLISYYESEGMNTAGVSFQHIHLSNFTDNRSKRFSNIGSSR